MACTIMPPAQCKKNRGMTSHCLREATPSSVNSSNAHLKQLIDHDQVRNQSGRRSGGMAELRGRPPLCICIAISLCSAGSPLWYRGGRLWRSLSLQPGFAGCDISAALAGSHAQPLIHGLIAGQLSLGLWSMQDSLLVST